MAVTFRLTETQSAALREAAEREGRSMQEIAVTAIEEYVARRTGRRDDLVARIVAEDRAVLDRLGSV